MIPKDIFIAFQLTNTPANTFKTWNSIADPTTSGAIADLVDEDGNSTGFSLAVTTASSFGNNAGQNTVGSEAAAWVDEAAIAQEYFYADQSPDLCVITISGLDDSKLYNMDIFGSRAAGGNYNGEYSVDGFTTSYTHNSSSNTDEVEDIHNIAPTNGQIELSFRAVAGQDSGYLNALKLRELGKTFGSNSRRDPTLLGASETNTSPHKLFDNTAYIAHRNMELIRVGIFIGGGIGDGSVTGVAVYDITSGVNGAPLIYETSFVPWSDGWNELELPTPVALTAGNTYAICYRTASATNVTYVRTFDSNFFGDRSSALGDAAFGSTFALSGDEANRYGVYGEARSIVAKPRPRGSATTQKTASGATHTANIPADVQSGELLVYFYTTNDSNRRLEPPTGWTAGENNQADTAGYVNGYIWKIADGTETGTQVFDFQTGTSNAGGVMVRFSDFDADDPFNTANSAFGTTASIDPFTLAADSLTGVNENSIVVAGITTDAANRDIVTGDDDLTLIASVTGGVTNFSHHTLYEAMPGTGNAAYSVDMSDVRDYGWYLVEIKNAPAVSVIITDVNTTESWNDGDTGLVITGSGFV